MYRPPNPFTSPDMAFQNRHQFFSPNFHQGSNRISPRTSPYQRSPNFRTFQPKFPPRSSSPFNNGPRSNNRSFNQSLSGSEQWSMQANVSYSSDSSSSSHFGDVSQLSPYNSPHRHSRSPYHPHNNRFQGNRSFNKNNSSDSNPGHFNDIRLYVHQSMLEDPWKELEAEMGKKTSN